MLLEKKTRRLSSTSFCLNGVYLKKTLQTICMLHATVFLRILNRNHNEKTKKQKNNCIKHL